ncbi:MAG: autotransporter-associated beta strand repeat-containing protein [Spartobacteria bacterium]
MKNNWNPQRPYLLTWANSLVAVVALSTASLHADTATWSSNPLDGNWNKAANWNPQLIPSSAIFGVSSETTVFLSQDTSASDLQFAPGANAYTITAPPGRYLALQGGSGIRNDSGVVQNFVASGGRESNMSGAFFIYDSSDSESSVNFRTLGAIASGGSNGFVEFVGFGSAASATLINEGCAVSGGSGGLTAFINSTTADAATITNLPGSVSGASPGQTIFELTSRGGMATVTSEGATVSGADGGLTLFEHSSKASNATLIANGGTNGGNGGLIQFADKADGVAVRIELFGNGTLDISALSVGAITIGSLEGDGQVLLGSKKLTLGANNLTTTFSGAIQGTGSLTKLGTGALTLSGANAHSGSTTVSAGTLRIANHSGSGTGTGAVNVNAGTLGGSGVIEGPVIVGTGRGAGAFLTPGVGASRRTTTLTLLDSLTFQSDSTYTYKLNTKKAKADQVVANEVAIETGAQFDLATVANKRLSLGSVFTVISNTAATPIRGTFANLADGSTLNAGKNNFVVSYSGGEGNDLTLTVVP